MSIFFGGVALFLAVFLVGPKVIVWFIGYLAGDVPVPTSTELHGTQIRTWEHPTEGVQVEVSQVDVKTERR